MATDLEAQDSRASPRRTEGQPPTRDRHQGTIGVGHGELQGINEELKQRLPEDVQRHILRMIMYGSRARGDAAEKIISLKVFSEEWFRSTVGQRAFFFPQRGTQEGYGITDEVTRYLRRTGSRADMPRFVVHGILPSPAKQHRPD